MKVERIPFRPQLAILFLCFCCIGRVAAQAPKAPELAVSVDLDVVTINWSQVGSAQGYEFFYAPFPEADPISSIDMGMNLSASAQLPVGAAYYVAIQAYNSLGTSAYSNVESFSIAAKSPLTEAEMCARDSSDSRYVWPLAGENGRAWVINNYVDLDPGAGLRDYMSSSSNSARTYDGHNGVDIDIPTFREMDEGVDIVAIAGGRVTGVTAGQPDRSTSCAATPWNVVTVQQDDGNLVYYGHMKTNSPTVAVGQLVKKGEVLGQVGSSGCSTAPHLHLEIRRGAAVIDPFRDALWCDAPAYDLLVSLLTGILLEAPASLHSEPFKDPGPDISVVQAGALLLPISHSANGVPGDTVGIRLSRPSGEIQTEQIRVLSPSGRHRYQAWTSGFVQERGVWKLEFLANKATQHEIEFVVE